MKIGSNPFWKGTLHILKYAFNICFLSPDTKNVLRRVSINSLHMNIKRNNHEFCPRCSAIRLHFVIEDINFA